MYQKYTPFISKRNFLLVFKKQSLPNRKHYYCLEMLWLRNSFCNNIHSETLHDWSHAQYPDGEIEGGK